VGCCCGHFTPCPCRCSHRFGGVVGCPPIRRCQQPSPNSSLGGSISLLGVHCGESAPQAQASVANWPQGLEVATQLRSLAGQPCLLFYEDCAQAQQHIVAQGMRVAYVSWQSFLRAVARSLPSLREAEAGRKFLKTLSQKFAATVNQPGRLDEFEISTINWLVFGIHQFRAVQLGTFEEGGHRLRFLTYFTVALERQVSPNSLAEILKGLHQAKTFNFSMSLSAAVAAAARCSTLRAATQFASSARAFASGAAGPAATSEDCWKCGACVNRWKVFCGACDALVPLPHDEDYFSMFGL